MNLQKAGLLQIFGEHIGTLMGTDVMGVTMTQTVHDRSAALVDDLRENDLDELTEEELEAFETGIQLGLLDRSDELPFPVNMKLLHRKAKALPIILPGAPALPQPAISSQFQDRIDSILGGMPQNTPMTTLFLYFPLAFEAEVKALARENHVYMVSLAVEPDSMISIEVRGSVENMTRYNNHLFARLSDNYSFKASRS